jgi:hypothetical protein
MLMTVDLLISVVFAYGGIKRDVPYIAVLCRHSDVRCHVSNDARREMDIAVFA